MKQLYDINSYLHSLADRPLAIWRGICYHSESHVAKFGGIRVTDPTKSSDSQHKTSQKIAAPLMKCIQIVLMKMHKRLTSHKISLKQKSTIPTTRRSSVVPRKSNPTSPKITGLPWSGAVKMVPPLCSPPSPLQAMASTCISRLSMMLYVCAVDGPQMSPVTLCM